MRFNGSHFTVKLWVRSHRNGSRQEFGCPTITNMTHEPAGINSIAGNDTFDVIAQVCGGESQLAPTLIAVFNRPADAVKMSQHTSGP